MTNAAPDPEARTGEPVSYSVRRRETPADVLRNRVGVTGTLFGVAMALSVLLGRGRR